jgi:ATP/maltotriose-dependent transcriptional regulator MalT
MIRTNPNHEATKVIDNQDQTERLLRKLTEVLPLSALAKKEKVFLVSITHLASDRRLAIAREIAAYQKRRIKRIRRDSATDSCATYH